MAEISEGLEQQLRAAPNQTVALIVRTNGDVSPHLDWLASSGMQVTQQFRLSPGVAITCSGLDALQLLDQKWVLSIELDAPVNTMGTRSSNRVI